MVLHQKTRRDAAIFSPLAKAANGAGGPAGLEGTIWLLTSVEGADMAIARGTAVLWFLDGAFTVNYGRSGIYGIVQTTAEPFLFDIWAEAHPEETQNDRAILMKLISSVIRAEVDESGRSLVLTTDRGAKIYAETFERSARKG